MLSFEEWRRKRFIKLELIRLEQWMDEAVQLDNPTCYKSYHGQKIELEKGLNEYE